MWTSIIPNKMFNGWVKKGWIPNRANCFVPAGDKNKGKWSFVLEKDSRRGEACSTSEKRRLNIMGWKDIYTRYCVDESEYEIMQDEIMHWYSTVFDYVEKWLYAENFINIESGSFRGGYCAEENPKAMVVTNYNAPLAKKGNKLIQLKEKFGMIVAYFENLEKSDKKKLAKFAKHCEKKFDCKTRFN